MLDNLYDFTACTALDLFSGTGNIAYEFASRGCKHVTAVDINAKCVTFIRTTCKQFGIENMDILKADIKRFIPRTSSTFDIIYADPPFEGDDVEKTLDSLLESKILNEDGILLFEHTKRKDFSKKERFWERRKYGEVHISIFSA